MNNQQIRPVLDFNEVRVLGCLLEKEMATPEYYPLSLNALVNACNQKSSRDPVVSFDESTVVRALDGLREKTLVRMVSGPDSRVAKYRQVFTDSANLTLPELALLCVLMLRGPKTAGELRGRTERMHRFQSFDDVESVLQKLTNREAGPLAVQLSRQAGLKESRYAHLLAGPIDPNEVNLKVETNSMQGQPVLDRLGKLEQEVAELRSEVTELRQRLAEFKNQFE
jgi:uncharacterized protein YceH (UPF0502 family)